MDKEIALKVKLLEEHVKLGIWEKDLNTGEVIISPQLFRIFGEEIKQEEDLDILFRHLKDEYKIVLKYSLDELINNSTKFDIDVVCNGNNSHQIVGDILESDGKRKIFGILRDITESKAKESRLEIVERQFKTAMESSAVPIMLHAEDGEMILLSKSLLESTGYDIEEINTLKKWMIAVHPDDFEYNDAFVKDIFDKGVQVQGEDVEVIAKDGRKMTWQFNNSLLGRQHDGRRVLMTVCIDVTEERKRQAEARRLLEELSKSQILLEASLESPKGMIILSFDKDYNYFYFNKAHKETMKRVYNVDIKKGKSILKFITVEEDFLREKKNYDKALNGEAHSVIEKYGAEHNMYFETFYYPIIDDDNEVIGASVFSSDITERMNELDRIKESEAKYRQLYSSMSQGLAVHEIITDENDKPIDYRFVDINESYEKLFNYNKKDVIGKTIKQVAPRIEQYWIDTFGKVALTGESTYYENYSRVADKHFSVYCYSPRERQFAVLISDITERINREKQIRYLSYNDQLTGVYNRRYYEEQFIKLDSPEFYPLSLIMGDVNGLKLVNDSFGHLTGDKMLQKVSNIFRDTCREKDVVTRIGGDEFVIICPNTSNSEVERLVEKLDEVTSKEKVESIDISISFGYGTKTKQKEKLIDVFKEIEDDMYRRKLNQGASMRSKTIDLIIQTLYEKNEREMHHSRRVSLYCEKLSEEVGLDKNSIKDVKTAGLMHDIGKIGIDERILNKKTTLNKSEWNAVKKHSEIGYRILSSINELSRVAEHVLEHHERWDGKGYPKGLKGEEISIEARIVNIADTFDAMTGPRPYKEPLTEQEAIQELIDNKGTQFDPELVDIFIKKVLKK